MGTCIRGSSLYEAGDAPKEKLIPQASTKLPACARVAPAFGIFVSPAIVVRLRFG